ncbi:glutathione S-transferase family protein [Pontixanthobacter sp.]|uniref:glutathione S-transferase family protein n=1 Tax=Pontixanthobacter sp. TaxID=2792078 RepID=UPI003C7C6E5B
MLTVHHLGISQSERIVWLCEELQLEYDFKRYNRRADNNLAPDEYKALHPMGLAPVIQDGNLILGESGAICDYIDRKYGGSMHSPDPGHADFADHLFWFHFANGTVMTNGMMQLMLSRADANNPGPMAYVSDRTAKAWMMIEQRLAEAEFFGGGQLTTADIMMLFGLTTARLSGGVTLDDKPNTADYLKRIGERPAYQAAWAKCEPGMPPKLD